MQEINPSFKDWLRAKVRNPLMNKYAKLEHKWNALKPETRTTITFLANYGISAIPLSFLFFTILKGYYQNYFVFVLDTWVFLIFFEHYYKWIREGWKH